MTMLAIVRTGAAIVGAMILAASAAESDQTTTAQPADVARGHTVFETYCSVCHGAGGQGFIGPHIAGIPWTAASLTGIVRNGLGDYGGMPAFSPVSVSDADVAAIARYLASTAPPPAAAPSAAAAASTAAPGGAPDAARGATLYAANCAACHGAQGQGGFGPSLHGESSRKDFAAAVSWIENPLPPMPKLYPSPLSLQDVRDVAAFVEKL